MGIKSQRDFYAGAMFSAFGVAFAWGATNYTVGDSARMGPGYFPLLVGVLIAILGSLIMFNATRHGGPDGDPIGKVAWRPLVFIIGANLAFGVLLGGVPSLGIPAMGLIAAIFAAVIISSMAGSRFVFRGSLILAAILAVGSYLTFVVGLSLQFQVWPSFITG